MNRNPTLPKREQKYFLYWIDRKSFTDRFGAEADKFIDEVNLAINLIGDIRSTNNKYPVTFGQCTSEEYAEIIFRMRSIDGINEEDVTHDDILGNCDFKKREAGVSAVSNWYAEITFDVAQNWTYQPDGKWWNPKSWFRKYQPRLCRWAIHEIGHAIGLGHTRPGNFESLLDEDNAASNSIEIPKYDEAAICHAHGFAHPWVKFL